MTARNPLGIEYDEDTDVFRMWLPVEDEPPVLVGMVNKESRNAKHYRARTSFRIGDDFYGTVPQCRDWLWSMWQAAHASLPAADDWERTALESEAVL
ncbi:MAG: hypothetical protein ACSLFM_07910 [Tepidiformaceae bacterium]